MHEMRFQPTQGVITPSLKNVVTSAAGIGLLLALWLCLSDVHAQTRASEDLLPVTHPGVTTSGLSRDGVRALFSLRQQTWPDGHVVKVFVLPNRHPAHTRFAKEWLDVYPHQLQLAWDRVAFSGMGAAPHRVRDLSEMREKLANTPGALGYLERRCIDDTVHVISID